MFRFPKFKLKPHQQPLETRAKWALAQCQQLRIYGIWMISRHLNVWGCFR
jgi:hypothetical protein